MIESSMPTGLGTLCAHTAVDDGTSAAQREVHGVRAGGGSVILGVCAAHSARSSMWRSQRAPSPVRNLHGPVPLPGRAGSTSAYERDLDILKLLDKLGYDEAWIGEHHSCGMRSFRIR